MVCFRKKSGFVDHSHNQSLISRNSSKALKKKYVMARDELKSIEAASENLDLFLSNDKPYKGTNPVKDLKKTHAWKAQK